MRTGSALEQQGSTNIQMAAKPLIHHVCENQRCYFAGGIVVLSAVRRGHPGQIQSPDRLLAGRRARESANSWRTEEDGAEAEGRGRGQAGKKKKKKKKLPPKKTTAACSVCFWMLFSVFSLGFLWSGDTVQLCGANVSSQSTSLCELVAFVAECQQSNGERVRFAASWCEKLVVVSAHVVDEG